MGAAKPAGEQHPGGRGQRRRAGGGPWRERVGTALGSLAEILGGREVSLQVESPSPLADAMRKLAISISLGQFVEGVMRIMLLMEKDFTPYWKWLAHEFRKQEAASPYIPLLESLLATRDASKQAALIIQICGKVYQNLLERDFINGQGENKNPAPLFNAHNELMSKAEYLAQSGDNRTRVWSERK